MQAHEPPHQDTGVPCPVCERGPSLFHARVDGYSYFRCTTCDSLHIDRGVLEAIDSGKSTRVYDEAYWSEELASARQRAAGESLVRVGEAILYARRPIQRFLDVGAGPGFLLDALSKYFPERPALFHAVELFPPEEHSLHPNYKIGNAGDLSGPFDAGVCIEVVEHLTPRMLKELARNLAKISAPDSLWLFNTGMPDFVLNHDPAYLDPIRRGHIVSYGLPGLERIFAPSGFRVSQVPGKNYAWIAEFRAGRDVPGLDARSPIRENETLLKECPLLYQAAFESARASLYMEQMLSRTHWALKLDAELTEARRLIECLQAGRNAPQWHLIHGESDQSKGTQAALLMQLEQLSSEHNKMLNSHSWKLTRPLRALARVMRRAIGSV